jgi:hypothetical protein
MLDDRDADISPFLISTIVQQATRLSMSLCARIGRYFQLEIG